MRKIAVGLLVTIAALGIVMSISICIAVGTPAVQPEVLDYNEIELRRPSPMPPSMPFPREIHQEIDPTPALAGLLEPGVSNINKKDVGFEVTSTDDIWPMLDMGKPMVPFIVKTFKIPKDSNVDSVVVNLRDPIEIRNAFIEPTPKLLYPIKYVIDNETYSSSEPYPGKNYDYKVLDHITWGEVVIRVYPIQYIPARGMIIAYKNASISISLRTSQQSELAPQQLGAPLQSGAGGEDECVIITHPDFVDACEELEEYKDCTGISTRVVDTAWINNNYAGFDGPDLPAKIKKFIYERYLGGTAYVILAGDIDKVPTRYVYINDSSTHDPIDGEYVPCDLYFVDLCDWDTNNDGYYGALDMDGEIPTDTIDMSPELAIGRLPASTEAELNTLIDKILIYENIANNSDWVKKATLITTTDFADNYEYKDQIVQYFEEWGIPPSNIQKIYQLNQTEHPGTMVTADIQDAINEGCGFVNYYGSHSWYDAWSSVGYINTHANSLTNSEKMPIIAAIGCCLSAGFDMPGVPGCPPDIDPPISDDCIGEKFLLNPHGGGIAYFGATRTSGWGYPLDKMFWEASTFYDTAGKWWEYAIKKHAATYNPETSWGRKTLAEYVLLGDPTLRIRASFKDDFDDGDISDWTVETSSGSSVSVDDDEYMSSPYSVCLDPYDPGTTDVGTYASMSHYITPSAYGLYELSFASKIEALHDQGQYPKYKFTIKSGDQILYEIRSTDSYDWQYTTILLQGALADELTITLQHEYIVSMSPNGNPAACGVKGWIDNVKLTGHRSLPDPSDPDETSFAFVFEHPGWQAIGFPNIIYVNDLAGYSWFYALYTWDEDNQEWETIPIYEQVEGGRGYFVYYPKGMTIYQFDGPPTQQLTWSDIEARLKPGWNLVSTGKGTIDLPGGMWAYLYDPGIGGYLLKKKMVPLASYFIQKTSTSGMLGLGSMTDDWTAEDFERGVPAGWTLSGLWHSTTNRSSTPGTSYAVSFDGVNDYINISHSPMLNMTYPITIEAWIKLAQSGMGYYAPIVVKRSCEGSNCHQPYALVIESNTYLGFWACTSSGEWVHHRSSAALSRNVWHHVAYVYNGSRVKLYIDGKEDYSAAESRAFTTTNTPVLIGKYPDYNPWIYKGVIDEVRILNRALTSEEIRDDYNHTAPYPIRDSTVAYYHMDERHLRDSGTVVCDASDYGNDGTLVNNPAWASGIGGRGISLAYNREDTHTYDTGSANSGTAITSATTTPENAVLTFKSWYQTENTGPDKDYKKMFISTDGGANWTQVCQVSGTMDTWVDYSVNISVYAGKSANIKFEFNTTDHLLNNYEGWYIDDLKINVRPTARFTCVPSNPTTADTIQFIDTSRDSDGTIVSYLWDFGDGNTSSEQTPIYRYTAPGTYIVNQTVTDDDDAIDSMLKTVVIVVNEPLPMEGDVNGNGHVTSVDSQLLQDYLVDPAAHPLNDSQLTSANTYEIAPDPSTINIYDVMYIQKWLSDPSTPLWDEEHDLEVTVPPQP